MDVAVTGVPDERAGELPRAYVIRKNRKVQELDIVKYIYNQIYCNQKVAVNYSAVQSYAVISTNHKTNCTVLQSLSDTHNIHRGLQDYFITG